MMKGKTFFVRLLLVAGILILADKIIGALLHHFYFNIQHGEQSRMTYTIDSTKDDVIVLGSSRASHHYVPGIISDSLHESCYNAGKDKQGLLYDLAVLKAIVQRHQPHLIILDLTPESFESTPGLDELSVLLPYYNNHPEMQSIINQRSQWERWKTYSSLYCYNSLLLQIVFNNISAERDADANKGYVPLKRTWNGIDAITNSSYNSTIDSLSIAAFREIIHLTKDNNCRMAVVVSPVYAIHGETPTIATAKSICKSEQVLLFDYSISPIFNNKADLFSDAQHLNDKGATIFSTLLAGDLRPHL